MKNWPNREDVTWDLGEQLPWQHPKFLLQPPHWTSGHFSKHCQSETPPRRGASPQESRECPVQLCVDRAAPNSIKQASLVSVPSPCHGTEAHCAQGPVRFCPSFPFPGQPSSVVLNYIAPIPPFLRYSYAKSISYCYNAESLFLFILSLFVSQT